MSLIRKDMMGGEWNEDGTPTENSTNRENIPPLTQAEPAKGYAGEGSFRRAVGQIEKSDWKYVRVLGDVIGYGNMMDLASRIWQEIVGNAAFVVGPPKAMTVECPCESPKDCDWCCGTNWVTKAVADMIEARES